MTYILAALGVLFIVYGIVAYSAAAGSWFFAIWFVLGALAIGGAWASHNGWWDSLPTLGRCALQITVGVLFACFVGTQALIMRDFNDAGENGADYAIVLGSRLQNGAMSSALQSRLDKACDYLARNQDTRCIVSGGRASNEQPAEADAMADYLVEHGVSADRIIRESTSRTTAENLSRCAELLDPATDSVCIITSDFHLFRALCIARKAGYAHVCGLAAESSRLFLPNNMTRESLAIAKNLALGHM